MELIDYLKVERPNIYEEYIRKVTPFYYEPGVLYHPIINGYGCGPGGSKEPFEIVNGDYLKNGDIYVTMQSKWKEDHQGIMTMSEAHRQFKRFDESVKPVGKHIPNSNRFIYLTINNIDFTISQAYWRDYFTKRLGGRITVKRSGYIKDGNKIPYYELCSMLGKGSWSLKNVYSHDSIGREDYEIKHNVSVREFKKIVFGDENIKFKCQLFGHLNKLKQ